MTYNTIYILSDCIIDGAHVTDNMITSDGSRLEVHNQWSDVCADQWLINNPLICVL